MPDNRFVILLGSNINPEYNLHQAIKLIGEKVPIVKVSRVYETPPVGMQGENFLNAAITVQTEESPGILKKTLLREIELQLGRKRTEDKFTPRTIDLDIIIANGEVLDEEVFSHAHVCLPVAEILPELIEPISGNTLQSIAKVFKHDKTVRILPDIELIATADSPDP